ncbi:hypothetical protein ALC60_12491 [Trachymyrmex zeteki]|uniref:Uncharacterized protein n=1 Tax=Mycetomoellerius zeteki TaxID=64791 RepID=A0A151WL78_9HYME|nr:hypothetical protein ALC60_12491 [Trachymyrmex zeteki]
MTLRCCSCCTHKSSPSDTGIQHVRPAQVHTGIYTFAKVNAQSASRLLRGRRPHFGVARAGAHPTDARATTPRVHAPADSERTAAKIVFPRLPLRGLVLYDDGKGIRQCEFYQCKEERNFQQNCEENSQNYVVNEKDFENFRHCDQIFSCTRINFRSRGTGSKLNLMELSSTLELP